MTRLNPAPSAVAAAGAGIKARANDNRLALARRLLLSLAGLFIAASSAVTASASANNVPVGPVSMGSAGGGQMQPDLVASGDQGDDADWRNRPFWVRPDRYEPPTVETAPFGVTIIRGPGSRYGLSP